MIQNIVLLLLASTLAPYIMVPPVLLAPLPLAQFYFEPPSVLANMNLSRIYTAEEFRTSFKNSLRVHHPDRGGRQQVFQQIQGLKKIMSQQINYYDLYNLTDSDLSTSNMKLEQTVIIKQYSYFVESGIFYSISLLFTLAFTLESSSSKARMYMLLLIVLFGAYEFYMHQNPHQPSFIDFFYSKWPLFTQRKFMKRILIIWIALIKTHFERQKTEEQLLIEELNKERKLQEYKDVLERLKTINSGKLAEKQKYEKSWGFKIRNWISKGISIVFMLIIIKNMIPGLNLL